MTNYPQPILKLILKNTARILFVVGVVGALVAVML